MRCVPSAAGAKTKTKSLFVRAEVDSTWQVEQNYRIGAESEFDLDLVQKQHQQQDANESNAENQPETDTCSIS